MVKKWFVKVLAIGALGICATCITITAEDKSVGEWKAVTLPGSGPISRDAAFFRAGGDRGVVFAPGLQFHKESWFELASALQAREIASITLSDGSEENIHHAVQAFERFGFKHVTLVGGSMAGGGVLFYAREQRSDLVDQVIALAPYGGRPVLSADIKKLFVVAAKDRLNLLEHVRDLYERSAHPRQIRIYDEKEHAQHLLGGPAGKDLFELIVEFIAGG